MKTVQNLKTSNVGTIVMSKNSMSLVLIYYQTFIWVCHGGDVVHPLPVFRNVTTVQEVSTEQKKRAVKAMTAA